VLEVDAGEHSFRGRHGENEILVDLSPGRDYFIRVDQVWLGEKLTRESMEEGRTST